MTPDANRPEDDLGDRAPAPPTVNRLAGLPLFAFTPPPGMLPAQQPVETVRESAAPRPVAVSPLRVVTPAQPVQGSSFAPAGDAGLPGLGGPAPAPPLSLTRRAADETELPPSRRTTVAPEGPVDWAQVRAFRQQAAELLTGQLRDRDGLDESGRREIGRALILTMLRDHADALLAEGTPAPTPAQERALATAIFDALFGLGRLQPLVDDEQVENIEITGCDRVHLVYGDGRVRPGPPVADSDEELVETLAFLASRSGGGSGSGERAFSPANPILDLTLHGGARLAARAWITPRPTVVIRRHRLSDVDLDDLRALGMLDDVLVHFLGAAVRAGKSIVVSGPQGAGKTTLVRALCAEMDPWERIGTIETEYELHLHQMGERHHRVVAHEARPGTGERTADGRAAGEITLADLLYASLRLNLSRIIVGEVRGREVIPMFQAMQAGAGSLSTTHAHDARAAIERLVTCALEAGPHVTQEYAYLQIAAHIDLIVHIGVDDHTHTGGHRHRRVSEVLEVGRGEGGRPAITDVFLPGPEGRAVPGTRPSFLPQLQRYGFDPAWLDQAAGTWGARQEDAR